MKRWIRGLRETMWGNLQYRAVLLSVLLHLSFVLVWVILNWKGTSSSYDFGLESAYNGMPQSQKTKGKKVRLMERSQDEIKPEKTSKNGEAPADKTETNESTGEDAEITDAVDLAFMPGASAPSMLGGLRQYYPPLARELNVEATVYVSVVISKKGKVLKVKVSSVVLSKKLPAEQEAFLKKSFSESIAKSFGEVVFSRPTIEGKNIPIEMEQVVRYKLNE